MTEILDFKNALSEVGRACEALREFWTRHALPQLFEVPVTLCLEEVLSNVFASLTRHVQSVFDMTGLTNVFLICGSKEDALKLCPTNTGQK